MSSDGAGSDPAAMTLEQGYAEAVRRIEQAAQSGQHWLDLGNLPLDAIPPEIGRLAGQLLELGLGIDQYDPEQAVWKYTHTRYRLHRGIDDISALAALTALQSLDLGFCKQLTDLSPLAGLSALQSLDLSLCGQLTDFSPLAGLTVLQSLDLSGCEHLTDLSPLAGLTALQSLDLSGCEQLTDLSPLAGLTALQSLDLSWCEQLTDFSPLAGLTVLQSLDLSGCEQLTDLSTLAGLTALQSLNLSWCEQLTDFSPLAGLTVLQSLDLSGCKQLTDLSTLAGLTALQSLGLSWCEQLTDLRPLASFTILQSLDLRCCEQLIDLSPVSGLSALQSLNLYGVPLAQTLHLEDVWVWWPSLSDLSIDRLHAVPPEILSSSNGYDCFSRLHSWWHDLHQGEAESHEIKLFILGNGRVGKSELFRRLRGEAFHGDLPSTHGIQLGRFELCRHHDDRPIFLNAWDFGGQDIYLGTHALFLKSRAIFVLAWHPDMEDEAPYTEQVSGLEMHHRPLQYWLDYIHSLAGDEARVIVVQTQCARESDEAAPPLRDTGRLAWYRPTISCASQDDGVDSLRDLLKRAARHRLETPAPPRMPASWLAVRDQLATLRETERNIDRTRFDAICVDSHNGASSEALLHYLHQAGDVFHQPGLFGDAIVLDQQWALDGIYTLFDRGNVLPLLRGHSGLFAPEMLDALAWNGRYHDEEQRLLLSMMASCNLIFPVHQLSGTRYYVMIDALPDAAASANRIAMVWPADVQALEAVAEYAFLHDGVLRALLARIGRLAGRDAVYWRHGVCLYDARTASRARIDAEQRADGSGCVRMRTTGRDADALCERLIALLEEIRIGAPPEITRNSASARPALPHPTSERDNNMLQPAPIPPLPGQKPVVYFSYAWGGSDRKDLKAFAVQLHRSLEDDFDVRRDEEATRPGDRISEFMREIGRGARVLVLLSDKYVRSANCMQELSYLYDRHRADPRGLDDHVLPLMVDKGFRCGTEQRLGYVRYWKDELARLKQLTVGLEPHECLSVIEEMQAINRFVGMTDQVLKFMDDVLMPRSDDLTNDDFAAVKAALRRLGTE
jgi:internalin A